MRCSPYGAIWYVDLEEVISPLPNEKCKMKWMNGVIEEWRNG
jgi:hypothetical protein